VTALPRVEDLPIVVMPEEDMSDDAVHWSCCDWRRIQLRKERLFAFCGVELTDDTDIVEPGQGDDCTICYELAHRTPEWNAKTHRCAECPQDLFNPPPGGKR
jgi:hypothetical protein